MTDVDTTTDTPPIASTTAVVTTVAPVEPSGIEAMDAEQLAALASRIETQRANRPESLSTQIQALQDELTGAHRGKEKAVDVKHEAGNEANRMEAQIKQLAATLKRTEVIEAASVAGFKAPSVIADHLATILRKDDEADVTQLVTDLAATGAFTMNTPAKSAVIGGPGAQQPAAVDAGRQALADEIRTARGM
jgi:hypothetical protein